MANERLDRVRARLGVSTAVSSPDTGFADFIFGFGKSSLEGTLELIGHDPSVETLEFRRDNPMAGIASQFIGIGGPYVAAYKASRRIRMFDEFIEGLGNAQRAPIASRALQEAVRFTPFEAARPVLAAVTGGDVGEVTVQAAIDLGIAAGAGAVIGAFTAGGRPLRRDGADTLPGTNLNEPLQLQARAVAAAKEAGELPAEEAQRVLERLRLEIRREALPSGNFRAVGELELGNLETGPKELSRLFRTTAEGAKTARLRPVQAAQGGFSNREDYLEVLRRAGFPEGWEDLAQWPRIIRLGDDKAARMTFRNIGASMNKVNDTTYLAKEANDGMYVLARQARGKPGDPRSGDEWIVFKTDSPGKFVPGLDVYANKVVENSFRAGMQQEGDKIGAFVYDTTGQFIDEVLPWANYLGLDKRKSSGAKLTEAVLSRLGLANAQGELAFAAQRMRNFLREHLSPTMFQFSKSPRANYIHASSRVAFDSAEAQTKAMLMGEPRAGAPRSLWREILQGESFEKGPIPISEKLTEDEWAQLTDVWHGQMSPEQARLAGASDNVVELLETLQKVDDELIRQVQATQKATDNKIMEALPQHYMISRTWRGTIRMPILNEGGELVAYASGQTRKEALEEADAIIDALGGQGYRVRRGADEVRLADRTGDIDLAAKITMQAPEFRAAQTVRQRAGRPKFFEERHGVGGYISSLTKQDFQDIITAHVTQANKSIADMVVQHKLANQLAILSEENPAAFGQIVRRINDLAGRTGEAAQWQNRITDKVLAPVLGKDSASRIVRVANTLVMNFQLGALNLGFPVLNALTFMQTTLPHMHWVMSAPPSRISRYYTWWPVAGQDLRPRSGMGVLDTFKLMRESFRRMGKPGEELSRNFTRATNEGVVDPRLVEEWAGQNSRRVSDLKGAMGSAEGFAGWLRSVSEFLPGLSEKFARGHSFAVGHILGKDFLKFEGEQLYRFAKEFTNRTMFLYSTADRARLMTSPLGSLFGMFKNWQMHYIFSMLEYTGEAVARGNWKPLLWMIGGTGAVGGVSAQPLYMAANSMSEWMTDRSLMEWLYEAFGSGDPEEAGLADALFLGLPAYLPTLVGLPAFSMSGQAAAPFADPARDASMLFSFVHLDRMRAAGKAFGTAIENWSATGDHPANSQNVRDQLVRAFAPKSVYRTVAAWEGNALRSLSTSYPQLQDLSLSERLLYSAGLNPRRVELQYRAADRLWQSQSAMRERVQAYGKAWAEAQASGQWGDLANLQQRALAEGIDLSAVLRSAQTRMAKGREDMIERQFDPQEVWRFQRVGIVP